MFKSLKSRLHLSGNIGCTFTTEYRKSTMYIYYGTNQQHVSTIRINEEDGMPFPTQPSQNSPEKGTNPTLAQILIALLICVFVAAVTTLFIYFRRIKRRSDNGGGFVLHIHPAERDGLGSMVYSLGEERVDVRQRKIKEDMQEEVGKGGDSEGDETDQEERWSRKSD
jgi:hypothetical protein